MGNREYVKTQIDVLPDSAVDQVIDYVSYLLFSIRTGSNKVDTTIKTNQNTWAELDNIISQMDELPRVEDFPRCEFGRELVDIGGVS